MRRRVPVGVACAVVLVAGVVAAAAATGPRAGTSAARPRVAPADAPATVHAARRDVYQTLRLEGVVERRPDVAVTAPSAGRFVPVRSLTAGTAVRRGDRLGVVRACAAATTTAAAATTAATTAAGAVAGATTCTGRATVVSAPSGGRLRATPDARDVERGAPLAGIDPGGFRARLPMTDQAALYSLTDPPRTGRAEVVGGPSGFSVTFERVVYDGASGRVDVLAGLPRRLRLFEGLRVVVVFVTGRSDGVLTLPRSAVRGDRGHGEVVVLRADGDRVVHDVELGVSDARVVEIKGLPPGAAVVQFPLESDFAR